MNCKLGLPIACLAACLAVRPAAAQSIQVGSVLVRLIEQVEVPAQERGVLVSVHVREGQIVEPGAPLAQLEDNDARLTFDRAKLELGIAQRKAGNDVSVRFAQKSLEVNKAEHARAIESIEKYKKSISQSELDRLQLAVERSALEVEQARHDLDIESVEVKLKENELEVARRDVEKRKILAPLGGMVVQINRRRGEWVEPGEKVLRIVRIDRLRAEGFLSAKDLRSDPTGSPVTLTVDLPGQPGAVFPGKVVFVSPEIDPVNGQTRIWAEIENTGMQLRPGLKGKLTVDPVTPGGAPRAAESVRESGTPAR